MWRHSSCVMFFPSSYFIAITEFLTSEHWFPFWYSILSFYSVIIILFTFQLFILKRLNGFNQQNIAYCIHSQLNFLHPTSFFYQATLYTKLFTLWTEICCALFEKYKVKMERKLKVGKFLTYSSCCAIIYNSLK